MLDDKGTKKLRIAMLGTKGIPATWGGIERYVEEIATRLVARGHEVTVFGSRWYLQGFSQVQYKGVRVIKLPTLHLQATDALTNGFLASIMATHENFDVVHFHGYASYLFLPLLKRARIPTVVTPHGVESGWTNPKYGRIGRWFLKKCFSVGIKKADRVTTVSSNAQKRIAELFNVEPVLTRGGVESPTPRLPKQIKEKYGLNGLDYLLFLGRIDPIKRVEWIVGLDQVLDNNLKIVIAGGAQDSTTERYFQRIKGMARGRGRVVFAGPVVGDLKAELLSNCLAFLNPSADEGMPLAVLEAASYARCCIASDIPAHREVLADGKTGFLVSASNSKDFAKRVSEILSLGRGRLERVGIEAKQSLSRLFDWDKTAQAFEAVYREVVSRC